eukprot:jgi/Bigna1/68377/fgenesh1_pg.6_\
MGALVALSLLLSLLHSHAHTQLVLRPGAGYTGFKIGQSLPSRRSMVLSQTIRTSLKESGSEPTPEAQRGRFLERLRRRPVDGNYEVTKEDITKLQGELKKCKLEVNVGDVRTRKEAFRLTQKARMYNIINRYVGNPWIGIASALIICGGAMFEAFEAVESLEEGWHKGINKSALGLAIIAIGHFMHYFKELLKEFIELDEAFLNKQKQNDLDQLKPSRMSGGSQEKMPPSTLQGGLGI